MSELARSLRILGCTALSLVAGCGGCAGSRGQLAGVQPNAQFVTEPAVLFINGGNGIERMRIDGTDRRVVFARRGEMGWSVLDASPDLKLFLLGTSDTELFVGDAETGSVRPVVAVGHRVSTARFSPDGRRFAAARHSDYSVQHAPEDDTIYVGDTVTLATEEIAPATAQWPSTLRWALDGSGLWVKMNWQGLPEWITLADRARHHGLTEAPVPLDLAGHPQRPTCAERPVGARWDTTLRMIDAGASDDGDGGRVIVRLEGRKRGFHDYQADFYEPMLSPRCDYVVFGCQGAVWVTDAKGSGAVASLASAGASALFFAPAQ